MPLFRKKSIVIEAVQFTGEAGKDPPGVHRHADDASKPYVVTIHNQPVFLSAGDWIVPEPDGIHHYPITPEVFANSYTPVTVVPPLPDESKTLCYYFGCWEGVGHYLFSPDGHQPRGYLLPKNFPIAVPSVDTNLLPPNMPQEQGRASLVHIMGWTILTFWDRSVDTRSGSNSAFIIEGTWDFPAMVQRAKAAFPHVWQRYKFEIVLWDCDYHR